ncbi:MAG: sulfite exporter TauE/SafE family protein [Burkholderiales bacterium]
MELAFPAAMAALGLASGVHCAGMCGGIVAAFSLSKADRNREQQNRNPIALRLLLFNAGRISSYALGGAIAGGIGSLGWYASGGQAALSVVASVVLGLVGMHLAGLRGPMRLLEGFGIPLWRRIQPVAARLTTRQGIAPAYAAGLAWGWLPCGLVYGALGAAAFAGSPEKGAVAMLAYGLGTAPWLLAAGVAAAKLRAWMANRPVRLAVGGTVLGFGVWGLAHAGVTYICS